MFGMIAKCAPAHCMPGSRQKRKVRNSKSTAMEAHGRDSMHMARATHVLRDASLRFQIIHGASIQKCCCTWQSALREKLFRGIIIYYRLLALTAT